jgi:acetyl esterase
MALDPQVQALLEQLAAAGGPDIADMSVGQARALIADLSALGGSGPEVESVENMTVPGPGGPIPIRLYRPSSVSPSGGPPPLLVWFHGGGWVIGDLDSADSTARELCAGAGVVVASVDYPLAPEHPYPAGPEAVVAATRWLAEHASDLQADGTRVAVGGDSAGGNLAALTAIALRDQGGPDLAFQLLVYPATDLLMSYPSVRENGEGYLLTATAIEWFVGHYLSNEADAKDPAVSPMYADDLSGLPPTLVITAEYDPLRDEGEAYAKRLEESGSDVTVSRYDGQIHAFFGMTAILDGARQAVAEATAALKVALSS